jgi:hypothetical protein
MNAVLEKPEVAKRAVVLIEPRIGMAESKRQDFVVDAEEGTTVEDVLDPMYWAHVASKFTPYDRVEVRIDTGEWMLELIVLQASRNFARMHLVAKHDLSGASAEIPRGAIKHRVEWKGTHKKWCVVRIADSAMLQDSLQSKEAAAEWMTNYERTTGG